MEVNMYAVVFPDEILQELYKIREMTGVSMRAQIINAVWYVTTHSTIWHKANEKSLKKAIAQKQKKAKKELEYLQAKTCYLQQFLESPNEQV
jgi:hypothetical protein